MADFSDLTAVLVNCSLVRDPQQSHTRRLLSRVAGVMASEGVGVEVIHALEHQIAFGMVKDATEHGAARDDWPALHAKIMEADIFVMGSPIWLGVKSSVATLVIERMYAYSGDRNDRGQYLYYGKTGGCVITGNEDGAKACSMEILYALSHIGFVVPPQADCAWLGEAGPGPSYGDVVDGENAPAGYENDFTNRNATIMSWNLMHTARLLEDMGGFPVGGNVADDWQRFANAGDMDPDAF